MNQEHSSQQSWSSKLRGTIGELLFSSQDSLYIYLILGGITLLGFILRVIDINKPIAYDEAYTFVHYAFRSFKYILADYSAPNNHILHTILVGIVYRLFGGQVWVLRLPAFLAGMLMIPAMYFTARRFVSPVQALGASALIAITRVFITYSDNARGYTLLILLALLLANIAGLLVTRQSRSALLAFTVITALGFYTIPIFLYPWAGISLWVVATYFFDQDSWQNKFRRIGIFAGACILAGVFVLILYSPVIFFGSGLGSITSNDIVQSLDWSTFFANLDPRATRTWNKWMIGISSSVEYLFIAGFLISIFFYRKVSRPKLPLQIFLALAVAILLFVQRVTPLPRIWLYLEAFYLMFAAAALIWLIALLLHKVIVQPPLVEKILASTVLVVLLVGTINILIARQQNPVYQDRDRLPEEYAANYLAKHLQPEDTIIAAGPVDIQTAYFLNLHGIAFDRFFQRDHPVKIQTALIMVRKNSQYKTPEDISNLFDLNQILNLPAAQLVFQYANVQIYSVPAKGVK